MRLIRESSCNDLEDVQISDVDDLSSLIVKLFTAAMLSFSNCTWSLDAFEMSHD